MTWTTERVMQLRDLCGIGLSYGAIAKKMELSRGAVIGKALRLRLNNGRPGAGMRTDDYLLSREEQTSVVIRPARKKAPSKEPAIIQDTDIPKKQRRTLLELTNHTCRWPVGDPRSSDFFFCGGPADLDGGKPYCPHHMYRAHRQPAPPIAPEMEAAAA